MLKRVEQIKKLDADWMHSEFYPAASDAEIADFEQRMQIAIPESYKAFLRIANGASLFGGDCILYSADCGGRCKIGDDLSEGNVPKALLIVGIYHTQHICYDERYGSFFFYEYKDYERIKAECPELSDFAEVLDYLIDVASA